MAKKDFSKVSTGNVYGMIAEATADAQEVQQTAPAQDEPHTRKTYTEAEAAEFMANLKTTGRKGVKLPRINMAFTPELFDYIKTMSRVSGITQTEFVNNVLAQYKAEHYEQYEKALEFRQSL